MHIANEFLVKVLTTWINKLSLYYVHMELVDPLLIIAHSFKIYLNLTMQEDYKIIVYLL